MTTTQTTDGKHFRMERIENRGRQATLLRGQIGCYAVVVQGVEVANRVAADLLHRSQWFQVEPRPDDEYEIAVKDENRPLLKELCAINR